MKFLSTRQGLMRTFSKHYSKCKTVSIKFRKTFQERRLQILKFSQTSWLMKNIFITLQYSSDILGIFLKQTFVECSSNITWWLLELAKRSTFAINKSYTFKQKQLFYREFFKKSFPLRCSLNGPWMSRTSQHWGITQRIFQEHCVSAGHLPHDIWHKSNLM